MPSFLRRLLKRIGFWLRSNRNWTVWYACAIHAVWGFLLLSGPDALGSTAVAAVHGVLPTQQMTAFGLLGGCALALIAIALVPSRSILHLILLLPQQSLLVLSAYGAAQAAIAGHYADGVARPWEFILADQFPSIAACVFHTLAIVFRPHGPQEAA